MNRINTRIGIYTKRMNRLLDILWVNPFGFGDIDYWELAECMNEALHKITEWESIRDAIRRPLR